MNGKYIYKTKQKGGFFQNVDRKKVVHRKTLNNVDNATPSYNS